MKQKSLKSFFGQAPNATPKAKTKNAPPATPASDASMLSSQELRTPEFRPVNSSALNSSAKSLASSGVKSTPPTSDAIDVDMDSGDEHPVKAVCQDILSSDCHKLTGLDCRPIGNGRLYSSILMRKTL
jgi:hypothetical protein